MSKLTSKEKELISQLDAIVYRSGNYLKPKKITLNIDQGHVFCDLKKRRGIGIDGDNYKGFEVVVRGKS